MSGRYASYWNAFLYTVKYCSRTSQYPGSTKDHTHFSLLYISKVSCSYCLKLCKYTSDATFYVYDLTLMGI